MEFTDGWNKLRVKKIEYIINNRTATRSITTHAELGTSRYLLHVTVFLNWFLMKMEGKTIILPPNLIWGYFFVAQKLQFLPPKMKIPPKIFLLS